MISYGEFVQDQGTDVLSDSMSRQFKWLMLKLYTTSGWHRNRFETRSERSTKIPVSERDLQKEHFVSYFQTTRSWCITVIIPVCATRTHSLLPGECSTDLQRLAEQRNRFDHISLRLRWACRCENDLSDCTLKFCLLFIWKGSYVSARISSTSPFTCRQLKKSGLNRTDRGSLESAPYLGYTSFRRGTQ
jgi:hypothetical protein